MTNSFKPLHEKHGIEVASIVIILERPLDDFEKTTKEILRNQDILTVHHISELRKIEKKSDGPFTTETVVNGFVLKTAGEKPQQELHAFNEPIRTVIIYNDYNYDRWSPFFEKFKAVMNTVTDSMADNKVSAVALEYVDTFIWQEDPTQFTWNELFSEQSNMLSKDFQEHTYLQFQLLRTTSIDEKNTATEQLTISREDDTTAKIRHHLSRECVPSISINRMARDAFYNYFEELHDFNKQVLSELLTKDMAKTVGLPN